MMRCQSNSSIVHFIPNTSDYKVVHLRLIVASIVLPDMFTYSYTIYSPSSMIFYNLLLLFFSTLLFRLLTNSSVISSFSLLISLHLLVASHSLTFHSFNSCSIHGATMSYLERGVAS